MTAEDFARLAPNLEKVQLAKGVVLVGSDESIEHAYFLDSGIGSIIATSPEGLEVEAGLFGRDGVAPASLLLSSDISTHRILIQVPDDAWRIAKTPFLVAVEESASLRKLLLRYAQTLSVQTGCTALSNAVHPVDQPLPRRIQIYHDPSTRPEKTLTHEFMSIMLAVRRPSVTTALHVLEGNGYIYTERGIVVVRDRKGLEDFAADAYGKPEALYRDLIGPMA